MGPALYRQLNVSSVLKMRNERELIVLRVDIALSWWFPQLQIFSLFFCWLRLSPAVRKSPVSGAAAARGEREPSPGAARAFIDFLWVKTRERWEHLTSQGPTISDEGTPGRRATTRRMWIVLTMLPTLLQSLWRPSLSDQYQDDYDTLGGSLLRY